MISMNTIYENAKTDSEMTDFKGISVIPSEQRHTQKRSQTSWSDLEIPGTTHDHHWDPVRSHHHILRDKASPPRYVHIEKEEDDIYQVDVNLSDEDVNEQPMDDQSEAMPLEGYNAS